MADLSCFSTKKNADEGKWFPVKIDGVKVPMAVLLFGTDSDIVQEYERNKIRKIGIGKNGKADIDEEVMEELLDSVNDDIVIRIGGISSYDWKKEENIDEPLTLDGKEVKNTKAGYLYLVEHFPALKDWIKEKTEKRSNFLD